MKSREKTKKKHRTQVRSTQELDPEFINKVKPLLWPLKRYFRFQVKGLENFPKQGPAIVVMNHGIVPYHAYLFHMHLHSKLGIYPRGLGASFLFDIPFINKLFLKGGAVEASMKNAVTLLKDKNVIMLSPGGIYEALIAKKGMKRIPWERRQGFVRLAIQTQSPIIPTYCKGINSVYYNFYFLLKARIKILEMARFSLPLFFGLGLLPLPKKLIHLVGKSIPVTKHRGEIQEDHVQRIHDEVLAAMEDLARTPV